MDLYKNNRTAPNGMSAFRSRLKSVVLPITFQQFMLAAVGASDALMLGFLNQDSLSAVSLASQVQFIFYLFLAALMIGTNMFAAQYWGKGDTDAVERLLGIALRPAVAVSLFFFLTTLLTPRLWMRLFTPETFLIDKGAEYLTLVSLTCLFCGISQIYLCVMKSCGLAGRSTLICSCAVVLSIGLNAVLIFGLFGLPSMGIAGAADGIQ